MNFQSLPPVIYSLQQDHPTSPASTTNWGPNVLISKPMGAFSIKPLCIPINKDKYKMCNLLQYGII